MKKCGLDTIGILVTRRAGKIQINFTGSPEQVVKAEQILAAGAAAMQMGEGTAQKSKSGR